MTTKHIEKLDPALIRPGRCDVKVEFKLASKNQIRKLFLNFYPSQEKLADQICESIPEFSVSIAALQRLFLENKDNPQNAINKASKLIEPDDFTHQTVDISKWLTRLGLSDYIYNFKSQGVFTLDDLKGISDRNLNSDFGMNIEDRVLVCKMLKGDKEVKADFEFASEEIIKRYFGQCCILPNKNLEKEFLQKVSGYPITGHQLKRYFKIYSKAEDAVKNVDILLNPPQKISIDVNKIYKKETLEEWIKRNNLTEEFSKPVKKKNSDDTSSQTILDKMKEEDIIDTDDLMELKVNDFKKWGMSKIVCARIDKLLQQLKEAHSKLQKEYKRIKG